METEEVVVIPKFVGGQEAILVIKGEVVCHFLTTVLNSLTPVGCHTTQLTSDTNSLELSQTPQIKGSVPTKLPVAHGSPRPPEFLPC